MTPAPTAAGGPASPAGPTRGAGPAGSAGSDQRTRILDTALALVSELGAAGTSMRRLASACGLNVATIYHYFPSKADLLRAVIGERRYGERMATETPPVDPALDARARLSSTVAWIVERTLEEDVMLRLLVGEGLRGDPTARRAAAELIPATDASVAGWLSAGVPELAARGTPPDLAARQVRRTLLAVVIEHLATGHADVRAAADDLATALLD